MTRDRVLRGKRDRRRKSNGENPESPPPPRQSLEVEVPRDVQATDLPRNHLLGFCWNDDKR